MQLPQAQGGAEGWALADYGSARDTTDPAKADGVCSVELDTVPDGELWRLERIVVACSSSTATACGVYDTYADPAHLLDSTPAGNGDVADEAQPITLQAGVTLLVRWTGASVGAVGTVTAQWSVLRRTGG